MCFQTKLDFRFLRIFVEDSKIVSLAVSFSVRFGSVVICIALAARSWGRAACRATLLTNRPIKLRFMAIAVSIR